MADILQILPVRAPVDRVFEAVSTPRGLDAWWTLRSTGSPEVGATYELDFGPEYRWRARVTRCAPPREFELTLIESMADWLSTRVGFELMEQPGGVSEVRFHHAGWAGPTDHFRVSAHCWALYLRLLRRHVEHGEVVPYAERLDA